MNTLILICVLVTLVFGSRMVVKTLLSGSPQNMIDKLKNWKSSKTQKELSS